MSLKAHVGRPVTIHNNLGGTGPLFDDPRVMRFAAVTWIRMVVQTEGAAAALQHFFPGAQLGSEVGFGLDLEVSNRSAYAPGGGTSMNGGAAEGLAHVGMVAGTSVTLRQRLLPSCCVDPECLRYRCGDGQVCEGAARRGATYRCRTDGVDQLAQIIPGLEFATHVFEADRATLGVPQEFTLAGYRQRSAVAIELPLGFVTAANDTVDSPTPHNSTAATADSPAGSPTPHNATVADSPTPHSATVREDVLQLPTGFVSRVDLYRGTFRAVQAGATHTSTPSGVHPPTFPPPPSASPPIHT